MSAFAFAILALHYSLIALLCLFGLHRLSMVFRWLICRPKAPELPPKFDQLPSITVQIPLYNERLVASRIIDAVAAFDYPSDRLQIQIVDDSNDETQHIVADRVAHHQQQGVNITQVRRTERQGFKAGALRDAMETASGEFIAIFDADFIPEPRLLRDNIHYFYDDKTALVQFRWEHLNRHSSRLTESQAMMLDAHFGLEQNNRFSSGQMFNFNGTAGIWRTEAIIDAGHWSADTLTEDLDLSYRAQMCGWNMIYLNHVGCAGELPANMAAFKSQQHRWAKGGIEVMKKLFGQVWRSNIKLSAKVEASFHLSINLAYLIMLIDVVFLLLPSLWIRDYYQLQQELWVDIGILFLASFSHLVYLFFGQMSLGHSRWKAFIRLPRLLLLGLQLAYNNACAAYEALRDQRSEFVRTPKSGELEEKLVEPPSAIGLSFYRAVKPGGIGVELILACIFAVVAVWALMNQRWLMLPVLLFLVAGFSATAIGSMTESRRRAS